MNVVVTGSRDFKDSALVFKTMDLFYHCIQNLFVGDAKGVDYFCYTWAVQRSVNYQMFTADWTMNGRAAGPMRNKDMLTSANKKTPENYPLILLAFPGGIGTENCVKQAKAMDIQVLRVQF
jgi:hypothetical protein